MHKTSNFALKPLKFVFNKSKEIKRIYQMKMAHIHPEPVIILGNQKSGTTVIATLLGKATGQKFIIDPLFRIENQIEIKKNLYCNKLKFSDFIEENKFYFSFEIIKEPNFTFFFDDVKNYFSLSKFIFIVRDPRDNIRSILDRLKIPGNLSDLDDNQIDNSPPTWQLVLKGKSPNVFGNSYIEKLAHRWNLAADTYIHYQSDIILIRYEDFILDKKGSIIELAEKINFSVKHDITPYMDKQYQPRGDRQITWLDFFGKDNLKLIEEICSSRMNLFDYR